MTGTIGDDIYVFALEENLRLSAAILDEQENEIDRLEAVIAKASRPRIANPWRFAFLLLAIISVGVFVAGYMQVSELQADRDEITMLRAKILQIGGVAN